MINEDVYKFGFKFFPNYFKAIYKLGSTEEKARFCLAIVEYMFQDKEPEFDQESDEALYWEFIVPNLNSSKRMAGNGGKAKGHGKGPRESMKGNQNAKKDKG